MASAATPPQHHRRAILVLAATAFLLASPVAAATTGCEADKLPAGKSYANCAALPTLGARLHWTYDAKSGSLSVAFVAKPAAAAGWVSWAVNPSGDGMKGAQALLALKGGASGYVVNTYNLTGYAPLGAAKTPIAYQATDLAADESAAGGEVRIYGKLQLGAGLEKVNHIWQVGAKVTNGAPAEHEFGPANVKAKGTLVLSGSGGDAQSMESASAPAPAPAGGGAGASPATGGGGGGAAPSAAAAATAYVSAPALALLALLAGFLAM